MTFNKLLKEPVNMFNRTPLLLKIVLLLLAIQYFFPMETIEGYNGRHTHRPSKKFVSHKHDNKGDHDHTHKYLGKAFLNKKQKKAYSKYKLAQSGPKLKRAQAVAEPVENVSTAAPEPFMNL